MMIAVYARQSVDRADSISTESQIEACAYEAKGEYFRQYVDKGYSGKNTDRPQFQQLVCDIEKGEISKVIVYRLDRISRSLLDFSNMMEMFARYRVEFVSSSEKFDTSTPMGRAMLNICMVFAQLERETIQQRVTDAYYSRSDKGFYMGGRVPYGFRLQEAMLRNKKTKTYCICREEAEQIQLMYELYAQPGTSYGDILRYFQEHNFTRAGKPWTRARIADHLKNPVYVRADFEVYEFFRSHGTAIESDVADFIGVNGCYYYKGKDTQTRKSADLKNQRLVLAPHEGIVPAVLWLKCRKKCLSNKQIQTGRKATNTWLAGLVKCGRCGYALTVKKYSTRARYLLCSHKMNSGLCEGAGTIYADEFENLIFREIMKKLNGFPMLAAPRVPEKESGKRTAARMELGKIGQEIDHLAEKVALANDALMKLINERIDTLSVRKQQLEQSLAELAGNRSSGDKGIPASDYADCWEKMNLNDKRTVADSLIEVIFAAGEKVEIKWKI